MIFYESDDKSSSSDSNKALPSFVLLKSLQSIVNKVEVQAGVLSLNDRPNGPLEVGAQHEFSDRVVDF